MTNKNREVRVSLINFLREHFSLLQVFVTKIDCCNIGKHGVTLMKWRNFLILKDSTCQLNYKVNTYVRPYEKNDRVVTPIHPGAIP